MEILNLETNIPRIVIAGTHSGVGKTTITTGLMAAFTKAGVRVQPYKVGPDYIDPSYHTYATGNPCRNLDTWMLGADKVIKIFQETSQGAEIAIIEGVMGLYDGASGRDEIGSTAQVAKLLKAPVILILDVKSMARSAAAIVLGFKSLDPELKIAGVILNRIGSQRHYNLVKDAIEHYTQVPILGYIKKNAQLALTERHLGLVPMVEKENMVSGFAQLASIISEGINLKIMLELAQEAGKLESGLAEETFAEIVPAQAPVQIAIAKDQAFSFYYQDSLDLLEKSGATLVPFSPLEDQELPDGIAGLYIGGGFPELYLPKLSANQGMLASIRKAHQAGLPIYAECGGLMYLCREIIDFEGNSHQVAGLVPASCQMEKSLRAMGYIEGEALEDNLLCGKGEVIRGHEFHYSDMVKLDVNFPWAFNFHKKTTGSIKPAGYFKANLLASYLHVNFVSNQRLAQNFVAKCREYSSLLLS